MSVIYIYIYIIFGKRINIRLAVLKPLKSRDIEQIEFISVSLTGCNRCKCIVPSNWLFIRRFAVVYRRLPQQGRGTDADTKETGRETDFDVERKDFVVEVDGA